jgi:hypothetical protein
VSNIGVRKTNSLNGRNFGPYYYAGMLPVSGTTTETSLMLRYEYILNLTKERKFVPSVGFAGAPYYVSYNFMPYITSYFTLKDTYIGMKLFVVPHVNYNINKRISLDLNIPLFVTDINANIHKENTPMLNTDQRTTTSSNFSAIPEYFSARLGVGIKI